MTEPPAPHVIDLVDGYCSTHDTHCDVDWERDEYITDPVDEPMVWDGVLRAGEVGVCARCGMPVGRVAGRWGHTRQGVPPGGPHEVRALLELRP